MKRSVKLIEVVNDKDNNFNLLRFGAALSVIISHSFILTNNLPNAWPKILGFLAVNCFFIISGFLVCKSLLTRNSLRNYALARVLRIYPALIVAVVFCAFVIGPIFTSLPLMNYFSNPQTLKFIAINATLLGGGIENSLPGVFDHKQVNAPLWTLFYELYMYVILAIIAFLYGFRSKLNLKRFSVTIYLLTAVIFVMFIADIGYRYLEIHFVSSMVRFGAMFGMGAVLFLARTKVTLSVSMLLMIVLLIALASINRLTFNGVSYFFLGYILLCLAYVPKGFLLKFNKLGDYSYGLYIFAYPIQQVMIQLQPQISTFILFIMSFSMSLLLAVLSWHFVESRALKLKGNTVNQ